MIFYLYAPEINANLIQQVLRGEKEIREAEQEYGINPNLIRQRKAEFSRTVGKMQ